jgi:hypothetical protein
MASYPVLPSGASYYQSHFPPGLKYSQGWYVTCTWAPSAIVYLYDDDQGICLFSVPIGPSAVPSGMQDGHTITPISITNAQAFLQSYPLIDFTAIDAATLASMTHAQFYQGVWGGDKLAQKWSYNPANFKPSVMSKNTLNPGESKSVFCPKCHRFITKLPKGLQAKSITLTCPSGHKVTLRG